MPPAKKPPAPPTRKSVIDGIVTQLPGVVAKKIGGLDAYFVNDRMFAAIHGDALGLRLPAAVATDLQFSRGDVSPCQPAGMPSSREWIQVARADPADYAQDLEILKAAHAFVKGSR